MNRIGMRTLLLMMIGFALGGHVVHAQDAPPDPQRLSGVELERAIDRAIDRGVTALSDSLGDDDTSNSLRQRYPMGYQSLIAYALVESGENPGSIRIRDLYASALQSREKNVYSVSLALLALDALAEVGELSEAQRKRLAEMTAWLVGIQRKNGYWGYGNEPSSNPWNDLSNTQFAALGLAASARRGFEVPKATWLRLQETLGRASLDIGDPRPLWFEGVGWGPEIPSPPEATGTGTTDDSTVRTPLGWGYTTERTNATPSMISAGVSTLLIARDRVEEKLHGTIDRRIIGALVGLSSRFHEVSPDPSDSVHRNYYYTIYSLEKALDLAACERLGGVDWDEHHAKILIGEQDSDGFWAPPTKSVQFRRTSTAFALLFLNRATLRHRVRIVTGAGSVEEYGYDRGRVLRPGGRRAVDLDDLFSRLAETSSDRLEAIAREIVDRATRFEAPYLLPRLSVLRRDGAPEFARWAVEEQRRITGMDAEGATADGVDAWYRDWSELQRVRREKPRDANAKIAAVWDRNANAELRSHVLDAWSGLGRFESAPFLIERLASMDATLAARAHDVLVLLTGERDLAETPASNLESVWTTYWKNHGKDRRDQSIFRDLAERLERASTPEEADAARAAIIALGDEVLPRIESEIAKPRFRADWLLIREQITGVRTGF